MKSNYTHFILVLDESGSMAYLRDATIEGVNSLIQKQKEEPGDFTTALYKFSWGVNEVSTFDKLTQSNYRPDGSTALLDAICTAITKEGQRLSALKESERPDKVVVLIVTDGQENNSKTYTIHDVKRMRDLQQNTYNWQFVFMGANIDAFSVAGSYGINVNSTFQWDPTPKGVMRSYNLCSATMSQYRSGASASMDIQGENKKTTDAENTVVGTTTGN